MLRFRITSHYDNFTLTPISPSFDDPAPCRAVMGQVDLRACGRVRRRKYQKHSLNSLKQTGRQLTTPYATCVAQSG